MISRSPVRIVALVAVFGVFGGTRVAYAGKTRFFTSPSATMPVNALGAVFHVSPSLSVGLSVPTHTLDYRVSWNYTTLVAAHDTLPALVHHGALLAETVVPRALGFERLHVAAGLGLGVRRLIEGRLLRNETRVDTPLGYYMLADTVQAGRNQIVGDLIGRMGVGVRLLETQRWNVAAEIRYEAAYGIGNPAGVTLDQRVDETIQFGLVLGLVPQPRQRP